MKFKAYHKIRQFKDIVRDINHVADYKGKDESGDAIYEDSDRPTLTFKGTVKLHGTNAGVCYTPEKGIFAQKRTSLLSTEELNSHMGFNSFVQGLNKEYFENTMKSLWYEFCKSDEQITLYGEWAGNGIQKGVGISELPKAFYVFGLKVHNETLDTEHWVDTSDLEFKANKVYNIYDFPTFEITIDFNKPALSQNKLIELTTEVERECPVSKQLGISGIGEGVVWTCFWQDVKYIFKVKGDKHSTSKVKKLASVDVEKVKSITEFVEYACTINRIEQGIKEVNAVSKKDTPTLLRWIANDIISEESDTLEANGLEWKDVARDCSQKARNHFFNELDKL